VSSYEPTYDAFRVKAKVNLDECERLNKGRPVCTRSASSVQPVYVVCRHVHNKCMTVGRYVLLPAQWRCWFVLYTS